MYNRFDPNNGDIIDIVFLDENGYTWMHCLFPFYATNAKFQQASRLCGNMIEFRSYYSTKYKLHGLKTKASVLPFGIFISYLVQKKEVQADVNIFRRHIQIHKTIPEKVKYKQK